MVGTAFKDKAVLVTGATGFLGGALCLRLAQEGAKVRGLARSPEKGAFLQPNDNITLLEGDITHADRLHPLLEGCDYVFHTAAGGKTLAQRRAINVTGTRNVMEAAIAANVQRVVHVSTIAVYGYGVYTDLHLDEITETQPLQPGNDPYAVTKAEAETVVRELGRTHALPFSIIRPGAIYGPRSKNWTVREFQRAKAPPIIGIGQGRGAIPAIYIDDVVALCLVLATHPATGGEAFNATPDPAPTWREFLEGYARMAGHTRWLGIPSGLAMVLAKGVERLAPPASIAKDAPALIGFMDTHYLNYKTTKAQELLGWQRQFSLEQGLTECERWLRAQKLL